MVSNGWRGSLRRLSTPPSANSLSARTSAVRRWLASLPALLSAKSRTHRHPTHQNPAATLDENFAALVAQLSQQYGVPHAEAAVYARLLPEQRAQMWAAELRTRLYYAEVGWCGHAACREPSCAYADEKVGDEKAEVWSETSSPAESAAPATPGGCEDWAVRVVGEVEPWGRERGYALAWGFVEG